jgi:hypothetical protein
MKHFEQLESRTLFSAPVAAVQSTTIRPTEWLIVVRYDDSEQPINPATIGTGDITVRGPAGYAEVGRLWQPPIAQSGNRYLGVYSVPAPNGAWDYGANGLYTVSIEAGAVADTSGETVQPADMSTFNLWFTNPAVLVTRNAMETNLRWWEMSLAVADNSGISDLQVGQSIVQVSAPDGSTLIGTVRAVTRSGPRDLAVTVQIPPLGRLWDYSDNGRYSVRLLEGVVTDTLGYAAPARELGSYYLWFTAPKIEITNSQLTDTRWIVTLRYSDDQGIDPAGFSGTRPSLSISGPPGTNYNRISAFLQPPSLNSDGSYTAIVYFNAPRGYWTWRESGQYRMWSQGGALDTSGNRVGSGQFAEFDHVWSTIDAQIDRTRTVATSTTWDIEMTFIAQNTLTPQSFANDDVVALGPDSQSRSASLISAVRESTGTWRVKYRFSGTPLSGNYVVSIGSNAVQDASGNGTLNYTFAPLAIAFA